VKAFEWPSKYAGKPFWDTTAIGRKESEMSIKQIDKIAARQFPMVGVAMPDEIKMPVDDLTELSVTQKRQKSYDRIDGASAHDRS